MYQFVDIFGLIRDGLLGLIYILFPIYDVIKRIINLLERNTKNKVFFMMTVTRLFFIGWCCQNYF